MAPGAVWAIVLAAGSGTRFGAAKQFAPLGRRRVVDWSVGAAAAACDGVVLVLPAVWSAAWDGPSVEAVVAGGATRSASVRAGLAVVPVDAEVVVVHDAARPAASDALFSAVVRAVRDGGADGAVPGLAVTDTLKSVAAGWVTGTLERDGLIAVQTPQAFRSAALRAAHAGGDDATDDAALIEAAGGRVAVVAGEADNVKITTPADLARLAAVLHARVQAATRRATGGSRPGAGGRGAGDTGGRTVSPR